MGTNKLIKNSVLLILFICPLLFYIFLQLSTHNFGKLPISVKNVIDVHEIDTTQQFSGKVSVVTFLGTNFDKSDAEFFNLDEKIYKKFYGYGDFQLILIAPRGTENKAEELKRRTSLHTDIKKMKFIFADAEEMNLIFNSFQSGKILDVNLHSSEAFIIDKDLNLRRGETKDKQDKTKVGYNMKSVAELKNEMHDDVKILLAEYQFALKKNRKHRKI